MAKIAAAVEQALVRRRESGCAGHPVARVLARGDGWSVADVVCASGPHDRPFEERHQQYSIAIVVAGVFGHRSPRGADLMTPGSLMLGSAGQAFECAHEHGSGDRCISFHYDAGRFEPLAAEAGVRGRPAFPVGRVPPLRDVAPIVARASAAITGAADVDWESLAIDLATRTVRLAHGVSPRRAPSSASVARVAAIARAIERRPDAPLKLVRLARAAGLSLYHFVRTFERVTGATPHQYLLRARLRESARRLATEAGRIVDVALDCGFGDVSNFNHAFRREFGVAPRAFRAAAATASSRRPCGESPADRYAARRR